MRQKIRTPLVVVVLLSAVAFAVHGQQEPAAKNALQKEMVLLDAAMRDSVTAIALGDVRALPAKLHAVHTAGGDTTAALKSGAYKTPQHPELTAAFIALDEAFHTEMIQMVKAAKKNDVASTAKHFGELMNRCHGCHAQFRDAPKPIAPPSTP